MAQGHFIIGTAGHVDHGKTALIRALTGVETDRLKEEQKRGISIELGFARLDLGHGQVAGVVDVPGHEKFIPQMLSGIAGIDLVLLVVDANEGVMPQTREHLQIMDLLQLKNGILVISKCDLVEPDWLDIVEEEIRDQVAGSFLEKAPCCRVSALNGEGLDELRETIRQQLKKVEPRDARGVVRLPVDRCFSISGFGTVVTGTLVSGTIKVGESLEVLPAAVPARVRELQVHDQQVNEVCAGQRVALNLAGISRDQIPRGSVVGTPGLFRSSRRIDVRLRLLADAPRPLKFRDPVHLHLGTARCVANAVLLDRDELKPGEEVIAQLVLDQPLLAHRGDRFIVRSYSPMVTIGGGLVIDSEPQKHKRFRPEVIRRLEDLASGTSGSGCRSWMNCSWRGSRSWKSRPAAAAYSCSRDLSACARLVRLNCLGTSGCSPNGSAAGLCEFLSWLLSIIASIRFITVFRVRLCRPRSLKSWRPRGSICCSTRFWRMGWSFLSGTCLRSRTGLRSHLWGISRSSRLWAHISRQKGSGPRTTPKP